MAEKKSAIWKFFTLQEDKKKAECQLCKIKLAYHGGTTNLRSHISAKHKGVSLDTERTSQSTKVDVTNIQTFEGGESMCINDKKIKNKNITKWGGVQLG